CTAYGSSYVGYW
nr:immunoglobulin heavy chain junction region [Mus musculus]